MKIRASVSTNTQLAQGTAGSPGFAPVSYEALFFGKRAARLVDPRRYPHLAKSKRKLEYLASEVGELFGAFDGDVSVALAEGSNASISREGELRVGVGLLEERQDDDDFLVALVGHEIGHQPWEWPEGPLSMTPKQLNALYRAEERKADEAMGRVLAKLGASPESMARFLLTHAQFEKAPPLDYDPADQRVALIQTSHREELSRIERAPTVAGVGAKRTRALR